MTKYIILVLSLWFVTANRTYADEVADSLFSQAAVDYSEGMFENALIAFQKIVILNIESPELYFNIGNCYYKLGDYSHAILNYERALLLQPNDDDIQHNLSKARYHNIDKVDEIPQFILRRWINGIIILFHSNIWAVTSIITFFLALLFLILYFTSMHISMKRIGFYIGLILLFFSVGSYSLASRAKKLVIESNGAIVMSSTVTIKGAPRLSGTDLFIIHEGTKVFILNSIDEWYEIKLSDGKRGWLLKTDIEVI